MCAEAFTRYYRGNSMRATFRLGDCLFVTPSPLAAIQRGDVIVFRTANPSEPEEIVHRVVAISSTGLVTQGDNNSHCDSLPATADNLIGRVTHFERDGKIRRVVSGRIALMRVWLLRAGRRVRYETWQVITGIGCGVYRPLRTSRILARIWRPAITQITLTTEQGACVKYVCNGQTIARWYPRTRRFECCKPYDLVLAPPDSP